jgi:isoleucyl-tRNA synthetase
LREEGFAREIVHAVQGARKAAGLEVEDRIELALDGEQALVRAAERRRDYIASETLSLKLDLADDPSVAASEWDYSEQVPIEGLALSIRLRLAAASAA